MQHTEMVFSRPILARGRNNGMRIDDLEQPIVAKIHSTNTNHESDEAIVAACCAGHISRFGELVHRYQRYVLAICINILGDADEARDATQDAFMQSYLHIDRFDMQKKFKPWLAGIAVKRCLDRLKKRRSFTRFFTRATHELPWSSKPHATSIEDSPLFFPLLKKLNDKERIALVLRVNDDASFLDISAMLGCSEATARVHFFNAKQKVQRALTAEPRAPQKRQP